MDKEIQSQLYDPKKIKSAWLNFVMKHKHIKLPGGRINLKAISRLWHAKGRKAYDPQKKEYVLLVKYAGTNYYRPMLSFKSKEEAEYAGRHYQTGKRGLRGRIDAFKVQERNYDPHRLIKSKEEGGREVPEAHNHYHKNIKIYDIPAIQKYISGIRNKSKKEYAIQYLKWKQSGEKGEFPKSKDLSAMAEQAVYFTINRLYDPAKHGINRPPKRWFYAMLKGIEKRSDVRNPAAIVGSIWKRLSKAKRLQIKRKELQGKQFKYDLPLPDDRATHGTGTLRMVKPFKLAEVQVNVSLKDYLAALKSGLFQKMKRGDGTTALVARCKSAKKNCNIFVDKDVK